MTTGLSSYHIATASDCQEENWSVLSFTGKTVDELLSKFDNEVARVRQVDFLGTVMGLARAAYPGDRRHEMSSKKVIAVVTGEPVVLGDVCTIEMRRVIFVPEEKPGWENRQIYMLRCSGALSATLQETLNMSDVLIISGYVPMSNVQSWTKTFLDLTGPNVTEEVKILRLTSAMPGKSRYQWGFAEVNTDAGNDGMAQCEPRGQHMSCEEYDDFDANNNIGLITPKKKGPKRRQLVTKPNKSSKNTNPRNGGNGSKKENGVLWIFVPVLVVVALLSFWAGRLSMKYN